MVLKNHFTMRFQLNVATKDLGKLVNNYELQQRLDLTFWPRCRL